MVHGVGALPAVLADPVAFARANTAAAAWLDAAALQLASRRPADVPVWVWDAGFYWLAIMGYCPIVAAGGGDGDGRRRMEIPPLPTSSELQSGATWYADAARTIAWRMPIGETAGGEATPIAAARRASVACYERYGNALERMLQMGGRPWAVMQHYVAGDGDDIDDGPPANSDIPVVHSSGEVALWHLPGAPTFARLLMLMNETEAALPPPEPEHIDGIGAALAEVVAVVQGSRPAAPAPAKPKARAPTRRPRARRTQAASKVRHIAGEFPSEDEE